MKVDVVGRVNNISLSKQKALLPLYEAIINSLQAIEESDTTENKYIKIVIKRDVSQQTLDYKILPIEKIIVEDNGVGFNENNFTSFQTADSTYKLEKGAKGNGRFIWLKAFREVVINSNYLDETGCIQNRSFKFTQDKEPLQSLKINADMSKVRTTVELNGFREPYSKYATKKIDTIAQKIIEHCISYLVLDSCPSIVIEDGEESININDYFRNEIVLSMDWEEFDIRESAFEILHVKVKKLDDNISKVHLCANQRTVDDFNINKIIPSIEGKIETEDGNFCYSSYIFGKVLDKSVNTQRTGFNLDEDNNLVDDISIGEIKRIVAGKIKSYLKCYLDPINENKIKKIEKYVDETNPQYKALLKYKKEALEEIAASKLDDTKLELELFQISQQFNLELKKEGESVLTKDIKKVKSAEDIESYKSAYEKYAEKENDVGKASLANYIIHRKVILELLEKGLEIDEQLKYEKENYIHNLIFPMRTTSEEIGYEKHNLWIIDEKLAYHYYLASDIPFSKNEAVNVDDDKRPDLLIVENPIAVVNEEDKPYNSIVIIEFKRPMRDDYSDESNPISQMIQYAGKIIEGGCKDRKGRPIQINNNTQFYLYAICDITPKLRNYAETMLSYTKTPDGMGYFGYHKNINAYVEVTSFDKLLGDAKKRNRVLFDKLFTPHI